MTELKTTSSQTYEIGKVLTEVSNARLRMEVLLNDKEIPFHIKGFFKDRYRNLNCFITEFEKRLTPENLAILQNEMISPEASLQVEGITNMVLELPKNLRDEVEHFVEEAMDLYLKSKKS